MNTRSTLAQRILAAALSSWLLAVAGTAKATIIYDAGAALKTDMLSATPTNIYTAANGGVWRFGRTTNVTAGFILNTNSYSEANGVKGWTPGSGPGTYGGIIPSIVVNTASTNVSKIVLSGNLTSPLALAPGEIMMDPYDPQFSNHGSFSIMRFTVPFTGLYDIAATFRDLQNGGASGAAPGADVHVVVHGVDLATKVVSIDGNAPVGSVTSFTANLYDLSLTNGWFVDFVVGPHAPGTNPEFNDATGVTASLTYLIPEPSTLVLLLGGGWLTILAVRRRR